MSHDETDIGKIDTTEEMQQMAKPVIHFDIQTNPVLDTYKVLATQHPCVLTGHRPAHRVDGGIECYDCGARFA